MRTLLFCHFFFLLLVLPSPLGAQRDRWQWLIIHDGFMFPEEEYRAENIYEGGAWSLYFEIEQELKIAPDIRRFLSGNQIVLFKLQFDAPGKLTFIEPVERYFWYSIDNMAREVVDDLMKMISGLKGWKKQANGTVYLPLRFRISGGRIAMDYNAFVTMGIGKVKIGRR